MTNGVQIFKQVHRIEYSVQALEVTKEIDRKVLDEFCPGSEVLDDGRIVIQSLGGQELANIGDYITKMDGYNSGFCNVTPRKMMEQYDKVHQNDPE